MADHQQLSNFIWQMADLLRGPYRPPQWERVITAHDRLASLRLRSGSDKPNTDQNITG